MEDARLFELAQLVMDATRLFNRAKAPCSVHIEIGQYPEVYVNDDIRKEGSGKRYYGYTILADMRPDKDFKEAEAHIVRLMEEYRT